MRSSSFARRFFILTAITTLIAVGLPAMSTSTSPNKVRAASSVEPRASKKCVGAAATWTPGCSFTGNKLHQSTTRAAKDRPSVYADKCWNYAPTFKERKVCKYGAKKPKLKIAVIGNSHAGHWVPALLPLLARNKSWGIHTYLLSSCYTVNAKLTIQEASANTSTPEHCRKASTWSVNSAINGKYDLVIISNRTATAPLTGISLHKQASTAQALYSKVLTKLTNGGIRTLVIRDTPFLSARSPECVTSNPHNWSSCSTPQSKALEIDPLARAASAHGSPLITLASPTSAMCSDGKCYAVIGGLVARFDNSHMTNSFARSFAPRMRTWVSTALSSGPRISAKKRNAGIIGIKTNKTFRVKVANSGRHSGKFIAIKVRGSGFKVLRSSTCKRNTTLAARSSCHITIRFRPSSKGRKTSKAIVTYRLGDRAVSAFATLTGRGR